MSIMRDVFLPLETIVTESNLIVEVKAIEPFEENVPIQSEKSGEPIPDFIKKGWVFEVTQVLKNTTNSIIPDRIRVPNENWRRFRSQHIARYGLGPNKSYNIKTYKTTVPDMNEAEILFLHYFQGTYELTARDSFEYMRSMKAIEKFLGDKN